MVVYLSGDGTGAPQLRTAEDLRTLSVRVGMRTPDRETLSRTFRAAGAGEFAGDHAWLDISWLRSAAGERDQDWHDRFTGMLGHAAAHGWLSADGSRVRAHVDREQADDH
ncbi:hypothetical protein GCM10022222_58670 [Amycolatopsis ultiminotia]|uniref:Uncharacterized protein n=1 Tax=Amycolatopsis ultiminotia TaxID=543629 RepID=A0ABP6XJ29_9PSEU